MSSIKLQLRRDLAATWTSVNPVLDSGETGFETDTRLTKIGDGTTAWTALAYSGGGGSLTVTEVDGSPSFAATTIRFPNGTVTDAGSGIAVITGLTGATGLTGNTGNVGQTGNTGATGPNSVSTSTATTLNGLLRGNGSTVEAIQFGTTANTVAEGSALAAKVTGPASVVNNDIAVFDGTTGKLVKSTGLSTTDIVIFADYESGVGIAPTDFRSNLELGNSATRNVGTTANTVAAGDQVLALAGGTLTGPLTSNQSLDIAIETIAYSGTMAVNAATSNKKHITLTGNGTISNPTNAVNGRVLIFRLRQDGTGSRIVTWGSNYRFRGDLVAANVVLSTTAAMIDRIGFEYDSMDDRWDAISFSKGS